MALPVPVLPKTDDLSSGPKSGDGGGSDRLRGPDFGGGDWRGTPHPLPERRYYTGMIMGLAAILMLFAAFTSAYVVRKGLSEDWQPTALPGVLWANTLVLLMSSLTLEKARSSYTAWQSFRRWWWLTAILGVTFVGGQLVAWRELAVQGVYVDTNPSSSFFYVLTGAHGVHLFGGLVALLYFSWRLCIRSSRPSQTAIGVAALYWHFMDGLWVYLLLLILLWR